MDITEVDPATDLRWQHLLERGGSQLFASPAWARVIQRTYGMEVRALIAEVGGEPVAGVPFARLNDPRGRRITTLPFSDFCDPIADTPEHWNALAAALLEEEVPTQIRCLHSPHPLADGRFAVTGGARWHAVEVIGDVDRQWEELPGSARRAVRTARKSGLEIRQGDSIDDVRAFFELHLGVRKNKYRLVAQPYRFFRTIWEEFFRTGSGRVLYAASGGEMVAGVLFLEWAGTWYYKFNASDPAWLDRRPNDLILWTAIERATDAGVARIDLGLSDSDQEGLIRYKDKYGRITGDITTLRAEPASFRRPGAAPLWGKTLGHATRVLTAARMPSRVTEAGGNVLYRYFA